MSWLGVAMRRGAKDAHRCVAYLQRPPTGALAVAVLANVVVLSTIFVPDTWATVAQFGSGGQGAGQFEEARGVAVEQETGAVYVVDRNNARVEKWSGEGAFVEAWGFGVENGEPRLQTCTVATSCQHGSPGGGAGQLSERATGVAVDNSLGLSRGEVYVVDAENNRVEKFRPDGEFILMFGGEVNATKVREAEEGNSVTSAEEDVCTEVEIESGVECKAGAEGPGDGEFEGLSSHEPAPIAVNADGGVYVGDANRVQRFSEAGAYEATVLAGAGEIRALAAAPGGDIYALSSEPSEPERGGVREYNASGAEVGPPRDEKGAPETIAAGPGGSLFVDDDPYGDYGPPLSEEEHSIRVYAADGAETQVFDEGQEDGENGIGWGEAAGALYVLGVEGGRRVRIVPQPPPGPVVPPDSELASEVNPTTAVLHATVNPEGQEVNEYRFEYGTSACTPASCGSATKEGTLEPSFEGDAVEGAVSGLKPETTYHFRVVASDSEGHRTVGPEATFKTLPALELKGSSVLDVAAKSATFTAVIDPLGDSATWRIEYASEAEAAKLGTKEAAIAGEGTVPAGYEGVTVSARPQSVLSADTTYHYRFVAEDEREGAAYKVEGPDRTFTTQGEGETLTLPDDRAWELVSPSNRRGAAIQPLNGSGPVQAAVGGGAIAYATLGTTAAAPEGNRALEAATVISTHGPDGWSSQDIATANETVGEFGPGVGRGNEYRLFSPDLSTALLAPLGPTPLPPLPKTAEQTLYLRHGNGSFEALVTAANVETGEHFGGEALLALPDETSPDFAHMAFISNVPLTRNASGAGIYEWTAGLLQLVSVLPGGTPASASEFINLGDGREDAAGAVANDGDVFWSTAPSGEQHLYMFDAETGGSVQLDTVQGGEGRGEAHAVYEGTSSEGALVFFTDPQELTSGASEGSLYEYDVGSGSHPPTLSDLTVPLRPGEGAGVQGLLPGVSADGSYVYVVATGVLTGKNSAGEEPEAGADNLYELHLQGATWRPTFIATLSGGDAPDWGGMNHRKLTSLSARVSPDGRYMAFMSQRSLTGYDNRDAISGEPDEEVYLYDADADSGSHPLTCVSCNPSGARPTGIHDVLVEGAGPLVDPEKEVWPGMWLAASVPGWTPIGDGEALYQSRYLDDSGRLFFDSPDALVPQAVNHTENVYEYEPPGEGSCSESSATYDAAAGGCVSLISPGTSGQESEFLDASESGDDVFFLSAARLTPQAPATGYDVYDAHVCAAGWACAAPSQPVGVVVCESAPECRASNAPSAGTASSPASVNLEGAGNLTPATTSMPKPKALTRARKLAVALRSCRRDKKKSKRKRCEHQARTRYGTARAKGPTQGRR